MRVRMRALGAGPGGVWLPGQVITVDSAIGAALVAAGAAVDMTADVVGARVVPAAPAQESAATVVPETPEKRPAPARRKRQGDGRPAGD